MSYFTSPTLLQGQQWVVNVDETWTTVTWNYQWSNYSDTSKVVSLYGSADEGQNWFILDLSESTSGPKFFTGKAINALKIVVDAAATGNSLTSQITGA